MFNFRYMFLLASEICAGSFIYLSVCSSEGIITFFGFQLQTEWIRIFNRINMSLCQRYYENCEKFRIYIFFSNDTRFFSFLLKKKKLANKNIKTFYGGHFIVS